ncbi:MAG: RNA polymerase sigma factor [Actinomycetota bacterium]
MVRGRDDVALPDGAVSRDSEQFDIVLGAARSNAGWAFERLFHTFAPRVSGYLRAQGAAEPDELTNDVFLSAFRALGRFEGDEAAFRAWLFTIARNRLIDDRRKHARRATLVSTEVTVPQDPAGGDVEDEALANLGSQWLRSVLDQIAPDQRHVLVLRVVGDLTIDQIADVMGKRPGAVKALQRRGLASVKRILDRQGRTPEDPSRRSTD